MPAPFKITVTGNGHTVVDHPGSVAVIPVMQADDWHPCYPYHEDLLILFCSQYRPGPHSSVIEIPAGTCDIPGEAPGTTGVREMVEEIGYRPSHLAPLGSMLPSPGYCSEVIHLFLAWGLTATDSKREFDPIRLSVGEALQQIADGIITDAKTIVALMKWRLLSDNLVPVEVKN